MSFLSPGWFWWLASLPVLAWLWARGPVSLSRRGRTILIALRVAAVALVIAAMARPVRLVPETSPKKTAVFVVDASLSVAPKELARAREQVEQAAARAKAAGVAPRLVLFGRRAVPADAGVDAWDQAMGARELKEARDGTDLEAALAAARAQVEPGEAARVFVLSDGNATAGDVEGALDRMRRAQLPVYTSVLEPVKEPGAAIASLEVPERAFAGDTLDLVVRVESAESGTARLVVRREDRPIHDQRVQIARGATVIHVRSEEKKPGLVKFHASLDRMTMADRHEQDNEAMGLCQVQPVPRVLIVADKGQPEDPLPAALASQGILHEITTPAKFPRELPGLAGYACVIFDNVPAKDFAPGALDAVERFNKESGGGFVMIGGRNSFAAGGYVKTPLERMLPVEMPTKSYSVSSGVVLLLDNSGSMTGKPLFVAKESAKALMRMLKGRMVGMWKFSSDAAEVFPPTVIGEDFSMIDARIDPIVPEGGTQFQPPLRAALSALESAGVENKYVILLSDGEPGDSYGLLDLVSEMAAKKIKISTVGIGYNVDPQLMHAIAQRGGGRYHQPQRLEELERAFADEVAHIVEGTPVIEEPFVPKLVKPHPVVRGFAQKELRVINGYVGTTAKPRAEVLLASHHGDPVLATWRYGLGVAAAWTPDVAGPWGRKWVEWEGFPKLWAQIVKATFRSNESDYALRTVIRGQTGEIAVDAIDRAGAYLNFLPLFAQVYGPGGRVQRVELPQRDPGRYQSAFAALDRGFYRIEVYRKDKESAIAVGGAVMSASPEFLARPADAAMLARMAQATGGQPLAGADALAEAAASVPAGAVGRTRDAWPPLVLLGLLVFFVEVALRRAGVFTLDAADGQDGMALAQSVAESYLRMARDFDAAGDHARAQEHYLKAHSHFLKARKEDEAKRMWERYRLLEERRG